MMNTVNASVFGWLFPILLDYLRNTA